MKPFSPLAGGFCFLVRAFCGPPSGHTVGDDIVDKSNGKKGERKRRRREGERAKSA